MNVVGRVGSLISQGVYSVATPFHPFGGAVDIIVVEQEDGTYRSTPWYVCFGKFQGVLKGGEQIVTISVNGVDANFHMFLDNSGRAYFMREAVPGSDDDESGGTVLNEPDTPGTNQDNDNTDDTDDRHSIYSESKGGIENEEQSSPGGSSRSSGFNAYNYGSLHEVEDLVKSSDDSNLEMILVSVDGHVLTVPISSNEETTDNLQLTTPQFHLGPVEGTGEEFGANGSVWEVGEFGDLDASISADMDVMRYRPDGLSRDELFKSCLDFPSQFDYAGSPHSDSHSIDLDPEGNSQCSPNRFGCRNGASAASQCVTIGVEDLEIDARVGSECKETSLAKEIESEVPEEKISTTLTTDDHTRMGNIAGSSTTERDCSQNEVPKLQRRMFGLGFEISLCGNLLQSGMGHDSADEVFEAHRISENEFKESAPSIIKNENLIVRFEGRYFAWDKAAHFILGKAVFGSHFSTEPMDSFPVEHENKANAKETQSIISPSRSSRWRLWSIPFRRGKSLQHSNSNSSDKDPFDDSESSLQNSNAEQNSVSNNTRSLDKQLLRTNIPTTEQIASLNLKEGQNMIAFSSSTRVLGKQQVDAHIYLWKWNAKIVISDVDGTITKSDVLGQFMPLVGKDWSQSGVARFFSAIKENGYQLLFLSARAIAQAYLTRSFLLNLKQDGKALPSGPVVISPDGLFPSLYREVIRRAPHEFKIACLEDIRALFPSDYNPFYAGFGNRDTDELSYRKIGIPKGKIFIINPKGEVAINHCVDVKTYTSLHTLVNDMFPPTSLVEQEDYNAWNYWKVPLPNID